MLARTEPPFVILTRSSKELGAVRTGALYPDGRGTNMRRQPGLLTIVIAGVCSWSTGHCDCPGLGPVGDDPNVAWVLLPDSVAACPAGDSLIGVAHPSRLRGVILYGDNCRTPKQGVPPESLWIQTTVVSGNLKVNDESTSIYPTIQQTPTAMLGSRSQAYPETVD